MKITKRTLKNFDYSTRSEFIVQFLDNIAKFDLTDGYSRKWFLPRYDFGKIHEPLMVKFMCRILESEDIFIDLGAHIGYFSILGAMLCKQVFAFEIDDNCIPIIQRQIDYNSLKNVEVINKAVSNTTGEKLKISIFDQPNTTLSIRHNPKKANFKLVETTSLSDFCRAKKIKPTLIKVDIEGAEYQALLGMEELMKSSENLKILLEVHPRQLKATSANSKMIVDFVNDIGYKTHFFGSHRNGPNKAKKIVNPSMLLTENTMFLIKR